MLKKSSVVFFFVMSSIAMHLTTPSSAVPRDVLLKAKLHNFMRGNQPPNPKPIFNGQCTAYLDDSNPALLPFDENRGEAKKVLDRFFGSQVGSVLKLPPQVRYVIALAPDPRHTNLSLMFDREISLLLQASQDEGFDYDSSWMPWKTRERDGLVSLGDQQYASELTEEREDCPGILLFRGRPNLRTKPEDPAYAYKRALVILIVGEQPTGGINGKQWSNAIDWLTSNAAVYNSNADNPDLSDGVLRVLGPTFTGSLASLARDLANTYKEYKTEKDKTEFQKRFPDARVLSGSVTGCAAIHWFQAHLPSVNPEDRINFGTFQENDDVHIARFLKYLASQGTELRETAIVSEDETDYGTNSCIDPSNQTQNAKDPIHLLYPRDISALREAYQKQSVFDSSDNGLQSHQHPILKELSGESAIGDDASDTVASLSGSVTAIDEEAYLYGLVSFLRSHHTRVLLLRCTNPLDFLFLTRFFHRAYPEARVVTVGSDLLIRREIDTTEFRGVLSLSSYPLLPRDQHWSMITEDAWSPLHNHLIFPGHLQEGIYIAGRYLLQDKGSKTYPLIIDHPPTMIQPIEMRRVLETSDYADPFWFLTDPADNVRSSTPPTWLAAVGRDGYWPVAVLSDKVEITSTMVALIQRDRFVPQHYLNKSSRQSLLIGLPLPWLVFALLALALVCYQLWGITRGGGDPSDGVFFAFHMISNFWQSWLLGLNSALAMMLLFELTTVFLIPSNYNNISSDWLIKPAFVVGLFLYAGMLYALTTRFGNDGLEYGAFSAFSSLAGFILFMLLYIYSFFWHSTGFNDVPLLYRSTHMTDGVSPLVPVLLLTFGFYLWNWQVNAGHLMVVSGHPTLPGLKQVPPDGSHLVSELRTGREFGEKILEIANPINFPFKIIGIPLFVFSAALLCFLPHNLPLISLEGDAFDRVVNGLLLLALVLTLAEAIRLYSTWIRLKGLLLALGRLRLRRTIASLRILEGKSVWDVSGSVRRVQYGLLAKQLDAANRLRSLMPSLTCLEHVTTYGQAFRDRSESQQRVQWDKPVELRDRVPRKIRDVLSAGVAEVYDDLHDVWHNETDTLDPKRKVVSDDNDKSSAIQLPLSEFLEVRAAEEFVSYHYVAFIQNITARMRTMTLSMIFLFIAACFAVSFYPFVPRTEIAIWLILNLALIGSAVAFVYAGMERDEILSYLTNTTPGRLGTEFWLKLAGFLVGPVIGILTTQFPSLTDNVLRWLQPGLDAIR